MTYLGLLIIILAWCWQWQSLKKKKKTLKPHFVYLYSLGVLFLVIDGIRSGLYTLALLNSASFLSAVLVAIRINKSK